MDDARLEGAPAETVERFCDSCFRPLIVGQDDLAIQIQDQIRESYNQSRSSGRCVEAPPLSATDHLLISARHSRQAVQHMSAALRSIPPLGRMFANVSHRRAG